MNARWSTFWCFARVLRFYQKTNNKAGWCSSWLLSISAFNYSIWKTTNPATSSRAILLPPCTSSETIIAHKELETHSTRGKNHKKITIIAIVKKEKQNFFRCLSAIAISAEEEATTFFIIKMSNINILSTSMGLLPLLRLFIGREMPSGNCLSGKKLASNKFSNGARCQSWLGGPTSMISDFELAFFEDNRGGRLSISAIYEASKFPHPFPSGHYENARDRIAFMWIPGREYRFMKRADIGNDVKSCKANEPEQWQSRWLSPSLKNHPLAAILMNKRWSLSSLISDHHQRTFPHLREMSNSIQRKNCIKRY